MVAFSRSASALAMTDGKRAKVFDGAVLSSFSRSLLLASMALAAAATGCVSGEELDVGITRDSAGEVTAGTGELRASGGSIEGQQVSSEACGACLLAASSPAHGPHVRPAEPLVGSWQVEVDFPGPPALSVLNLATFHSDGTVVVAAPPLLPETPGVPTVLDYFSAGHGAWARTGATTATVTFLFLVADAEGRVVSVNTVRGSLEVDVAGSAYRGTFTVSIADADGAQQATLPGAWEATRIRAEVVPRGRPGAPPGADR